MPCILTVISYASLFLSMIWTWDFCSLNEYISVINTAMQFLMNLLHTDVNILKRFWKGVIQGKLISPILYRKKINFSLECFVSSCPGIQWWKNCGDIFFCPLGVCGLSFITVSITAQGIFWISSNLSQLILFLRIPVFFYACILHVYHSTIQWRS